MDTRTAENVHRQTKKSMILRKIIKTEHSDLHPGFLGQGHLAAAVIDGSKFAQTDPFILLMDDRLDLPGGDPVGGPHPHAGFETVTLVLQGDDVHWKTGSLELMTAGKGIIHTEEITSRTHMHILQLWLVLPPEDRRAEPFLQQLLPEDVPALKAGDREIRVYSGESHGLHSPLRNRTPFSLVEYRLQGAAEAVQQIPASYNGFIYVLEGSVSVDGVSVKAGQSAWFDRPTEKGESRIDFTAGGSGTHFVLYAGEPQKARIVSHGPFIADTQDDIVRLYREYRMGLMPHLNDLPPGRRVRPAAEKTQDF